MHKALYAGYWLERFVKPLGNPESVGRIREGDLQSYYDLHYTPANMSIVGVGGMKLEELVLLLSESPFALSKKGVRTPLPIPVTDISPPVETCHVFEVSKQYSMPIEVGQYQSFAKLPGNVNRRVVHIMEDMFDEVLNEEVRERRAWAYAINTSQCNLRLFCQFSINCGALAWRAIGDIEEVIEMCIASMGDREDLFEQAKRRALASKFMIDPTGRGICNNALDDLAKSQRIISLGEIGDDFERATMNDVRGLLQWLRPEWRWTLITKP